MYICSLYWWLALKMFHVKCDICNTVRPKSRTNEKRFSNSWLFCTLFQMPNRTLSPIYRTTQPRSMQIHHVSVYHKETSFPPQQPKREKKYIFIWTTGKSGSNIEGKTNHPHIKYILFESVATVFKFTVTNCSVIVHRLFATFATTYPVCMWVIEVLD